MVSYYSVFGQKIGSHYLAIATLTTFFGTAYAFSGGKKTPAAGNLAPINASSSDEADFIKKFLEQSETEDKKAKH